PSPTPTPTGTPAIALSAANYSVPENGNQVTVTLTRLGDPAGIASVKYASSDSAGLNNCNVVNGIASSRCDYAAVVGLVTFASGESLKTISIPLVDDAYAEGNESFTLSLSNATGAGLGNVSTATITINDNEVVNGSNPIEVTAFFVREHYIDFLGREPDPAGYTGWQNVINNCASGDTSCDRIHVSGAFYQSPEFQERGYFVYRFYSVSFGRKPDYAEFLPDFARVSGFLSNQQLEGARVAFVADFIARPAFATKYDGLSNAQFVETLVATAGVTLTVKQDLIDALNNGTKTRAQVLREIVEHAVVTQKFFNQAFVVMQYFGYLRRDPDAAYLNWIQELNSSGNARTMINGFVNSLEYRARFGN
ncbi:MAG TPA: DUF4214 domain-containing protein, partial [Pyrinomonadaceae bacterium]|nr:DUF4214 domain-containing protein [Pyrinomonadaceae bacterium]